RIRQVFHSRISSWDSVKALSPRIIESVDKNTKCIHDRKQRVNGDNLEESTVSMLSNFTPIVQIPSPDDNSSLERLYY
ncbi:hypothetical protein M8C21_009962, partial [Ambrosia artemisiifolia]